MILVIGACFVPRTFSHRSVGYWERLQLLDARSCDLRLQKKLLLLYNKTLGSRVEEPTNWIQMGDGCAKIGPIFSWYQRERERTPDSSRPRRFIGHRNSSFELCWLWPIRWYSSSSGLQSLVEGKFHSQYHGSNCLHVHSRSWNHDPHFFGIPYYN